MQPNSNSYLSWMWLFTLIWASGRGEFLLGQRRRAGCVKSAEWETPVAFRELCDERFELLDATIEIRTRVTGVRGRVLANIYNGLNG